LREAEEAAAETSGIDVRVEQLVSEAETAIAQRRAALPIPSRETVR